MAEKRAYEVLLIVDTETPDDEFKRLTEMLQQIITDQGGTVIKTDNMGRRQLAYPINRKSEGNYLLLEVEGSGREIAELERRMRVNDQIMRYITVRVDEDRRRAEKFKAKRARKANKQPFDSRGNERRSAGGRRSREAAAFDEEAEG